VDSTIECDGGDLWKTPREEFRRESVGTLGPKGVGKEARKVKRVVSISYLRIWSALSEGRRRFPWCRESGSPRQDQGRQRQANVPLLRSGVSPASVTRGSRANGREPFERGSNARCSGRERGTPQGYFLDFMIRGARKQDGSGTQVLGAVSSPEDPKNPIPGRRRLNRRAGSAKAMSSRKTRPETRPTDRPPSGE